MTCDSTGYSGSRSREPEVLGSSSSLAALGFEQSSTEGYSGPGDCLWKKQLSFL